jgi:hypothetical protein
VDFARLGEKPVAVTGYRFSKPGVSALQGSSVWRAHAALRLCVAMMLLKGHSKDNRDHAGKVPESGRICGAGAIPVRLVE